MVGLEDFDMKELLNKVGMRIFDNVFKVSVASYLVDVGLDETAHSTLTVQEVIEKIKSFIKSEPSEANYIVFLHYLAHYPVSMCKREVSPTLRLLIGFHYRLGVPDKAQRENGAERVSYDDLAQIFVRSKATISECVNQTEPAWKKLQESMEEQKQIEEVARRELIEEAKQRIEEETAKQTNERPAYSGGG